MFINDLVYIPVKGGDLWVGLLFANFVASDWKFILVAWIVSCGMNRLAAFSKIPLNVLTAHEREVSRPTF